MTLSAVGDGDKDGWRASGRFIQLHSGKYKSCKGDDRGIEEFRRMRDGERNNSRGHEDDR